ncbi:MAG: hypothetical protein WAV54_14755 [Acidimicrobiales bacterium]
MSARTYSARMWTAAALAGVVLVGAFAIPAFASGKPTAKPTSITLKASKATVAPKHKVSLTATLKSGKSPLADEQLCLQSRTPSTTGGWSSWGSCANFASLTNSKGQVGVNGVVPGNKKGAKTQYEVVFPGATGYKASHSPVITVTVS